MRQVRAGHALASFTLMFQKEVAQRIVAPPDSAAYGRLAVLCQWLCNAKLLFNVPASAFTPPPKVTSSIVRLVPRVLQADAPPMEAVERVTAAAFGQRRKMIRSSMKAYLPAVEQLGIDPTKRAEALSVDEFIAIAAISARP
jgi:16S rRNA (adenine1518-N6/adenine1519-N6)-dimethyltransferase